MSNKAILYHWSFSTTSQTAQYVVPPNGFWGIRSGHHGWITGLEIADASGKDSATMHQVFHQIAWETTAIGLETKISETKFITISQDSSHYLHQFRNHRIDASFQALEFQYPTKKAIKSRRYKTTTGASAAWQKLYGLTASQTSFCISNKMDVERLLVVLQRRRYQWFGHVSHLP